MSSLSRFLWAILSALLAGSVIAGQAMGETRIAMIVGNGDYSAVSSLDNPVGDANLMARTLEQQGFQVTLLINAGQLEMNRAIAQFGRDLRDAGRRVPSSRRRGADFQHAQTVVGFGFSGSSFHCLIARATSSGFILPSSARAAIAACAIQ